MKPKPFYKFKIVSGLHKDAELFLEQDIRYHIGSSDDCDIILLDTGVTHKHLSFVISNNKIHLDCTDAEFFVDGKPAPYTTFELSDYQVVSIGDAHFAIGPVGGNWPVIEPPRVETEDNAPLCLDLVPLDMHYKLATIIKKPRFFQTVYQAFHRWISNTDKKILVPACIFLLALSFFVFDAWSTSTPQITVVYNPPPFKSADTAKTGNRTNTVNTTQPVQKVEKKSILLSALDGLVNVQRKTLVSTGLTEPVIPIEAETAKPEGDPVEQVRTALKKTWKENLTETQTADNTIEFKGYDEQHQQNLALNLKLNEQGEICAHGITRTPKKKKDILSQMNDMIRINVDTSEDMESVCNRVLKKKGIRRPKARFDIEEKALTLTGKSKDRKTISSVRDIISKAFPKIKIDNRIKMSGPSGNTAISGISTSGGARHVILKDGSKIFKGGRLDNGCTVVGIENDCVTLSCNGAKNKQRL